jgi:hypothetical protein
MFVKERSDDRSLFTLVADLFWITSFKSDINHGLTTDLLRTYYRQI